MDNLLNLLLQRHLASQSQDPTGGIPVTLPQPSTKVPQEAKRFNNAQAIQEAYRNGWAPNPVLLRAQLGNR